MENELRSIERETAQVEHIEDDAHGEDRDVLQRQIGSLQQMMLGKLREVQTEEERDLEGVGQQGRQNLNPEKGITAPFCASLCRPLYLVIHHGPGQQGVFTDKFWTHIEFIFCHLVLETNLLLANCSYSIPPPIDNFSSS